MAIKYLISFKTVFSFAFQPFGSLLLLCAKHKMYWPQKLADPKAHFSLKIGIDCDFVLTSRNLNDRS